MKKIFFILILLLSFISVNVNASEIYYTNDNGVQFTKQEYDFVTKMFFDGYQKSMTAEDYNDILKDGISNQIETKYFRNYQPNGYQLTGTEHTTSAKSLKITKSVFSSYVLVGVVANWFGEPTVKSYDVMGAFLSNVTLNNIPNTKVITSETTTSYVEAQYDNNGFGVSVKIPSAGSNLSITQTFKVSGSGRVYASYQHAKKSISLNNSKKYSIDLTGYGNVFLFDSSVKSYYDQMGGVDIAI